MSDIRQQIAAALAAFANRPLKDAAIGLLGTLGYQSEKTLDLDSSPDAFLAQFDTGDRNFRSDKALVDQWRSSDFLFQLTDEELTGQLSLFDEKQVNTGLLRSYLFFAVELAGDDYARGKLTDIARQINRLFPTPVMVLIKHLADQQPVLSIAVINRRQNKQDAAKDVLGKVTIIRNISLAEPHRGHLDILDSFALENLVHPKKLSIRDFDTLHAAWEEVFNVELLNKRFYRELANWYFWALPQVEFPADLEPDDEKRRATGLIRLLTRLIFCWFLKEKGLIPEKLFHQADLDDILADLAPDSSSYYQAILQNLFFATLNQQMGKPKEKNAASYRRFISSKDFQGKNTNYGITNLYRYPELFADPKTALEHFADIPFLNGGLFECLDREDPDNKNCMLRVDGFTTKGSRPNIPNLLFFSDEIKGVDLSDIYGDKKRRKETVSGLLNILNRYKFTIVENTPIDQEIALDPELLGKVFENLLASYNEETKTTARKQTGSFYTPRPIVDYMVDESLKAHLSQTLVDKTTMTKGDADTGLDILFTYTEKEHAFSETEVTTLLDAIQTCKILDPACGSGAFPMGALHKLVYILGKLDPHNERWKALQIDAASTIPDSSARDSAITAIERDFAENELDYGRKLYLVENCLYGVDIQPIAIQISKLRFFISLVCDQKTNRSKKDNHGVRPLPNLETKFVAADTLIGLKKDKQLELFVSPKIERLEKELQRVRHDHFSAQNRQKKLALQRRDRELRGELAKELLQSTFADQESSRKLADWNPYDSHSSAVFFEPLWMFDRSLVDGFDVVIGNPPYISVEKFAGTDIQKKWKETFSTYAARGDIYCFFYERGAELLKTGGTLTYITSNKWMRAGYGEKLRTFLSSKVNTRSVLDFGMAQNFGAATTYTCILKLAKEKAAGETMSCYATDDRAAMADPEGYFMANSVVQENLSSDSWVVLSRERQRIKSLVEEQGVPLKKWDVQINYGIKTGYNESFYLTPEQRDKLIAEDPASADLIGPLLRGRYVERYKINWDGTYQLIIKFGAHEYLEKKYPAVYHHLLKHETRLKARGQCKYTRTRKSTGNVPPYPGQHHWLELDNNPGDDYLMSFGQPKIIYQDIAQKMPFYLDSCDHFYFNNTCWMMCTSSESLCHLTAVLNSSLFRCCFRDNFPEYSGNAYRLFSIFFYRIPIKKPTESEATLFAALVPLIQLAKTGKDSPSDASAQFLEDLIDACVMECYFREHMAERDLLFHDDLAPHLASYDPEASESQQRDFLEHLHHTLNAPESKIRNRLLRITADSPDLLAIIKEEGKV